MGKSPLVFTITTVLVLLSPVIRSLKTTDTNTKAASPYTNCGCQCTNLQFRDKYNKLHGNCASVDHTGAKWCYVDPSQSTCQDLSYTSKRYPGTPWSYEACATPACGYNNGGYNNGGYNNGGFSNGGSINGGYINGGSINGGYNNGGSGYNNGGYNNGGYNNGGSINGGYGSSNCRGTKCGSGSISGGYNNGGSTGGFNNGGLGSSNCRGTKCGSGSYGSGSNTGFLAGILGGRSKTEDKDSVKFGN